MLLRKDPSKSIFSGLFSALLFLGACDWGTAPGPTIVETEVDIEVLEGWQAADTIEAHLPIRVHLIPKDQEITEPLYLQVTFTVLAEGCGNPLPALTESDVKNEASGTWVLGTEAQECTLAVRALAGNGILLGFANIDATITPGQPTEGWLPSGEVARGPEQLVITASAYPLYDRNSNEQPWRFQVVNGPAVVLGEAMADDRSRTLVATGEGGGEVNVISVFGTYLTAGFDVCVSENVRWIRVFRQEDAQSVLNACP